jgi:adenine-specific DNA-methyltransferase
MEIKVLKPKKALNKAFLKVKPNRTEIECFKTNLIQLLDRTNDTESEEFHKNLVSDFLKKTYYDPNHFINTKGRNDLVIHNGNDANSTVGVIIEAKKPTNKSEMISRGKLNTKAFHELVLYYLRERITHKNLEVKKLIVTNINEWFIFDATTFDRLFAQNKNLVNQFNEFESERLADKKTDFFYKEIAEPFIAEIKSEIEFTYFNLQEYQKPLRNVDKTDDNKLIALLKVLSPEHILKLPFANDSNSLDKKFYSELLHIIGLSEFKEGNKKLIGRNKEGERNSGTILEDAIIQLDSLDKISRLDKPSQFGTTQQERLFNVGLELSITWINRILFLKLLEAQLIKYHKYDKSYSFLNLEKIKNYDDLNSLFFQVLARKHSERNDDVKKIFEKIPYLNSSLFEPTEIEQLTIFISNLKDDKSIPIISSTVLRNSQGKRQIGNLSTLEYLFKFLDAYDFASEGSEEIQEDNKALINASVLGLIFEKINGYKDGSFFTPGFITMYMCRETIRNSVVQKFNEIKKWSCNTIEELYDKIEDRKEANEILNSIKICDPAVGSGHFLVSALNEMIAVKNDLKILQDRTGRRLKEYHVEVVNDDLIITDEEDELFEYNPTNRESQRIQEMLFHEKQTIIENCLFGVDINPNSVKICRLRLWIELLKNAYYKNATELETLPNIDINIKCGNSLVSRFAIDVDLSQALKKKKWTIDSYRKAVDTYKNAESKDQKREMEQLISDIKSDFRSEISLNDPKVKRLRKLTGDLFILNNQTQLFEMGKREKTAWQKQVKDLSEEAKTLETKIEEIKSNKIFENAFEWRFEFPEVLNERGDFIGFDVIIGNPPYIQQRKSKGATVLFSDWYSVYSGTADLSVFFFERAFSILKPKGQFAFITTNKFFNTEYGKPLRKFLSAFKINKIVNFELVPIFDEALVSSVIIIIDKDDRSESFDFLEFNNETINQDKFEVYQKSDFNVIGSKLLLNDFWLFTKIEEQKLILKIANQGIELKADDSIKIRRGITTGYDNAFIINETSPIYDSNIARRFLRGKDIHRYQVSENNLKLLFIPWHFPLHNDENINGASLVAEKSFESVYPAEYNHLTTFKADLSKRNKSETGIRYEWYSLQRCAASYYDWFDKEKIVWGLISGGWDFALDKKQNLLTSASFFLISENISIKYILALFNSKLYQFYFSVIGEKTAGGAYVFKKTTIEKFLIPNNNTYINEIIEKIDEIHDGSLARSRNEIEEEIDLLIYQIYNVTADEVELITRS